MEVRGPWALGPRWRWAGLCWLRCFFSPSSASSKQVVLQSQADVSPDKDWEDIRKMPEYPTLQKDFRRTT